uniref:Ig-like domain-containing protein n=1 Tax=Cyprinus carpio carpio TaxID=630221 RepID=A0A9J8CMH3_CYPCA
RKNTVLQQILNSECLFIFLDVESAAGVTVTQTPAVKPVQPGDKVTMSCKTSPEPEAVTVSEGQDAAIECKTDAGIYSWGLAWYQQKPGEAPKLIIYSVDVRNGNSFNRFSGNGLRLQSDGSPRWPHTPASLSSLRRSLHWRAAGRSL